MDWLPTVFILACAALPFAVAVSRVIEQQRFEERWRMEAAILGLESEGSMPLLRMKGTMDGVRVNLVQSVTYPYKAAAVYSYTARARVPRGIADERAILAAYRTAPQRAEARLARHSFTDLTDLTLVDGWFKLDGQTMLEPNKIEALLRRLVHAAKAEALVQAERDEKHG